MDLSLMHLVTGALGKQPEQTKCQRSAEAKLKWAT